MRWLVIALLVSLVALLIAAVGSALHIRRQRARVLKEAAAGTVLKPNTPRGRAEEAETETEI